jgi:hypothetical protein
LASTTSRSISPASVAFLWRVCEGATFSCALPVAFFGHPNQAAVQNGHRRAPFCEKISPFGAKVLGLPPQAPLRLRPRPPCLPQTFSGPSYRAPPLLVRLSPDLCASSSLLFPSFTSKCYKGLALTGLPSMRCPFTMPTWVNPWGCHARSTRFTHTQDLSRWLLSVASLALVGWVGPVPCGTQWAPCLSSGLSCWRWPISKCDFGPKAPCLGLRSAARPIYLRGANDLWLPRRGTV